MASRLTRIAVGISAGVLAAVVAIPTALAYPPNPETPRVIAGGTIIVVAQQTAQQTTPRKLLQPMGASAAKGQKVSVRRGAALAFVPTRLRPGVRYIVSARIDGRWVTVGTTSATDSKGQAMLPVIRITRNGVVPIRLASGTDNRSPFFFNTIVSNSGRVS